MEYIYIDSDTAFLKYLKDLRDNNRKVLALDIEAELNLHVYGEKLCLIQIFDGLNKLIIDPFKINNSTLKTLFENRGILKVMYDAASDLCVLKNVASVDIKSILDLRPAVQLLDYPKQDLHSVIGFELGLLLEKKSKYQRYNWMRRPINEEAIEYALNDVIHLLSLKDVLLQKLYEKALLEPFILKNLKIQNKDYLRKSEDRYKKIKGFSGLRDNEKDVFRKVFNIRDKYAKKVNMPPFTVINHTDLINITKDRQYIGKLRFPKRFSKNLIQSIIHELRLVKASGH